MSYIIAAATLWAMIGPVARFALGEGVSPLEVAFWRAAIGAGLFALHARVVGGRLIRGRDLGVTVGFGIVGVAFFYTAVLMAVETGGAALASVLLYTAPAWVALGAWLWLRERPERRTMVALVLAVAGVTVVAFAGGGEVRFTTPALLWGLSSGLAYALYYLMGRRYFALYGTGTVLAHALPVGAVALLPLVSFAAKSVVAWTAILFIAVVTTYVAYLLYGAGLRRVPATRAATVASLEPVIAATAAYLVWRETLGAWGYTGAAMVVAAVLLAASVTRGRGTNSG